MMKLQQQTNLIALIVPRVLILLALDSLEFEIALSANILSVYSLNPLL